MRLAQKLRKRVLLALFSMLISSSCISTSASTFTATHIVEAPSHEVAELCFTHDKTLFLFGDEGGVYQWIDKQWKQVLKTKIYWRSVHCDAFEKHYIAIGGNQVFQYTKGYWEKSFELGKNYILAGAKRNDVLYLATSVDRKLYIQRETTTEQKGLNLSELPVEHLFSTDETLIAATGGRGGNFYWGWSKDNGRDWQTVDFPDMGQVFALNDVLFINNKIGLASITTKRRSYEILATEDAGKTWKYVTKIISGGKNVNFLRKLSPDSVVLGGPSYFEIFKYNKQTATWEKRRFKEKIVADGNLAGSSNYTHFSSDGYNYTLASYPHCNACNAIVEIGFYR